MGKFWRGLHCFLVALLLSSSCFLSTAMAGDLVIINSPIGETTNSRGTERDDEALYGMVGEIVTGPREFRRYQVKMQYGYTTWIHEKDLLLGAGRAAVWERNVTHMVAVPFADVVPAPSTQSFPPLLTLPKGALVQIPNPNESGRYFTVILADGRQGYIRKPSVRSVRNWWTQSEEENRERIVSDSYSYLGSAYRWGGKTHAGIDCSGLASMVYYLNGLSIYRNAEPAAGYPIALVHVPGAENDHYTPETLKKVKKGDLIYWEGHQGIYLGEGKYIHANGLSFDTRINSFYESDPEYRADLAKPSQVYTWGTAYPERPNELIIREFRAQKIGAATYRFYGKVDGYTPNQGILYPEGKGEGKPKIVIDNLAYMLFDDPQSAHSSIPTYTYQRRGSYSPVLELINDAGWRPEGLAIRGEKMMESPIVVE